MIHHHHFHLHQFGIHQEISFHIRLNGQSTNYHGHSLLNEIEKKIREHMNREATIHIDPSPDSLGFSADPYNTVFVRSNGRVYNG
jgi:divalent metal cation (Fe/Co/Zn/Cd) transporter